MVFLKLHGAAQQPTLKCRGGALFGSTRGLCLGYMAVGLTGPEHFVAERAYIKVTT